MTVLYTAVAIASLVALLAAPFVIITSWGDHGPGRDGSSDGSCDPPDAPTPPPVEALAVTGAGPT